jgi:hypothetical protein
MANGHGGRRPGSGNKKGAILRPTLTKEAARQVAFEKVVANLEPLFEAQIANAKGIKYLVVRDAKSGKFTRITEARMEQLLKAGDKDDLELVEVWEKDPSVQAFTDLMNRALDKPKEQEQSHTLDAKIVIQVGKPW